MPLNHLATQDDIEARLGRALTDQEMVRVGPLLADASVSVRGYTGQEITQGTSTTRLKIRNGFVVLPQRPVTDVTAVADGNANPATYTWDGNDRVTVATQVFDPWSMEPYRLSLQYVDVTYVHGYTSIPDDIRGVVCGIVLRAIGQAPEDAGTISESIDQYSYRLGSAAAAGGYGLLQDERNVLDRYRRVGGSMRLAW